MDEHPHQPGQEPAGSDPIPLQHCEVLADDGHVSFVEIAKGPPWCFAFELSGDQFPHVASLLNRNLRNTRQRPSALIEDRNITDSEYAIDARYHQERIDRESSGSVGRNAQRLHDRRYRDASRPQYRRAWNSLSSGDNALVVDFINLCSRQNFDAKFLKPSGGLLG